MAPRQLVNPQFFTHHPYRGVWVCNLCPAPQKALTLSLAVRHEDTRSHAFHVRTRNTVAEDFFPTVADRSALAAALLVSDPWLREGEPFSAGVPTTLKPRGRRPRMAAGIRGPTLALDGSPDQIYDDSRGALTFDRSVNEGNGAAQGGSSTGQPTSYQALAVAGTTTTTRVTSPLVNMAEDMDQYAAYLSNPDAPTFDLSYRSNAIPIRSFPPHTINGEVRLSELGDIASTMKGF